MIEHIYMSQHPLIAAQLRQAMRGVASTVTLITSIAPDGHGHVMIASSFASVSLEPPTVLVCIGQQTRIHGPLLASRRFCINVLRAEQEVLAVHCRSATGTDRFDHEAWRFDEVNGLPYLQGVDRPAFCRHPQAIIHGYSRGVHEQQAIHG
ncbi:flavin reductase family protein [Alcaligenes phenolicus]|uniref:flavin reductase family protein n=1 Tax=Alcaligenes phenolicus TaxID=232846 RepID=UPI0038B2EE31